MAIHNVSGVRSSHEGRAGFGIGGKAEAERECLATEIGHLAASSDYRQQKNGHKTKRQGRHRRKHLQLSVLEFQTSVSCFSASARFPSLPCCCYWKGLIESNFSFSVFLPLPPRLVRKAEAMRAKLLMYELSRHQMVRWAIVRGRFNLPPSQTPLARF